VQHRQKLDSALRFLAERLVATGQNDEAEATQHSISTIWETLLAEQPQDRDAREQLALTLGSAANGLQGQSQRELRDRLLRRALALREELDATTVSDQAMIDSRLKRAQLHAQLGEWDKAIDQVEQAKTLIKDNDTAQLDKIAAVYVELCAAAWNQSKLDAIEAAARKAIELQPDNRHAHHWLGIALMNLGKQEEAIAAHRKAIEIQPDNFGYYRSLSFALWRHGELDEATDAIRKAIELQPNEAALYGRLGGVLLDQGKVDEALAALDKSIELNPQDAGNMNGIAWLLATAPDPQHRNADRAVELAKKAVELAPQDGAILNTLGVAQYRAGEWTLAIEALEKSMELRSGGDGNDWFWLAMAHWQLDHKDDASKWFDKAVDWMDKNAPQNEELLRFRAEAEKLLGVTPPSPPPNDAPQGDDAEKPKS
jgi:superkiller protein 3